jgi:hypothetical protein
VKYFGPYLYVCYWVTGGDKDKSKRHLKNKYLGYKQLAIIYDDTKPYSDKRRELESRIIAAMVAEELDELTEELWTGQADEEDK